MSRVCVCVCVCVRVCVRACVLVISVIAHLHIITTSNNNPLAISCTHLLTTAHTKSFQFVFTSRFLVMDVLILLPHN
jgi:hypothetical protein